MRLQARPIQQVIGEAPLILLAIADITELKRAATVLQEAHTALERRVKERTSELAIVNATLQAEIANHQRSEEVRQNLLQQLVTAQEEERRRVARELHDQLGQDLAGLILGLKALQDAVIQDAVVADRVRQLQALATQIGQEVRTLAVQLRPAVLDDLGLTIALSNYVEQWSARTQIAADLHSTGLDSPEYTRLPLAVESTLYRLVQESLTNILKHAEAQQVSIILARSAEEVRLIVEDDGVGFDIASMRARPPAQQRLGLVGMDERVAQLGGKLLIESTPGTGTAVFVTLPLAAAAPGGTDGTATNLSR
jgi:two-component system CheB/CheR fusion protein